MIKYEKGGGGINTSPLRLVTNHASRKNPRTVLAKPKPRPTVTPAPPRRKNSKPAPMPKY